MALRCLLFSSDEGAAAPIRQVLAGLGVEGESCSEGVTAVERVTVQSFQIVIIDWDQQPEAEFLLKTARERKASDRPLTLAIVSNDASVPKALQAGANSILRKPILVNQAKDTLTTARDLLHTKHESPPAAGAAAGSAASLHVGTGPAAEGILRAGEFLNSAGTPPPSQLDTDSEMQKSLEQSAVQQVDPLKDLEPVAASVAEQKPAPAPPTPTPPTDEPRGLQWYLRQRAAKDPSTPRPESPSPARQNPELLGFDQMPSHSPKAQAAPGDAPGTPPERAASHHDEYEQKAEAKLFAYISGEGDESDNNSQPTFRLGKPPIIAALVLASCAVAAAPQAPWHPAMQTLWRHGQQTLHAWLNPQPVTTPQAPESHENFGRAGDEYKLPVAEPIPDATTDPSQIRVVPVVDPTLKKPGAGADQPAGPLDTSATTPSDSAQTPGVQVQENPAPQNSQPAASTAQPVVGAIASQPLSPTNASPALSVAAAQPPSQTPSMAPPVPQPVTVPPRNPQPRYVSAPANVPSSLKSQMASMTPDASGNKPPETALPTIEPVTVSEAAERALVIQQPAPAYPATAKGQQGTVLLQVLIGRDGTVQDAKFLQGSLAFARAAIDGVKQWKFKPYIMNTRPVSVQTTLTMTFKPSS